MALASMQVNHSIPQEDEIWKVYWACVRPAQLYAAETWALMERLLASCDHIMLRYMRKMAGQDH